MSDNDGHHHAPPQPDDPEPCSDHHFLGLAVRELLIEQGVFSAEDERRAIETIDRREPALGARVVARAWIDAAFRARLLAGPEQAREAIAELGIDIGALHLVVVENTVQVHNVVVCTLCSCYPRMLLGLPPAWYKSREYRSRVVREPRAVLAEFGLEVGDDRHLRVHDSTADMRYLVLPRRPSGSEGMSEEQLATLVGRDAMIGVAEATSPPAVGPRPDGVVACA